MKTGRHPQNQHTTYRNAVRGGPSHGRRQHAQILVKFGHVVFELCERVDRQTDKQTDILVTIFRTLVGGEAIINPLLPNCIDHCTFGRYSFPILHTQEAELSLKSG